MVFVFFVVVLIVFCVLESFFLIFLRILVNFENLVLIVDKSF